MTLFNEMTIVETILDAHPDLTEARVQTLKLAISLGAGPNVLERLATARLVSSHETIVLPAHRYERLSRGRGWARKGRGDSAEWGQRVEGGYEVGPGKWVVGGSDGFSRKGQDVWEVVNITLASDQANVWTVAD